MNDETKKVLEELKSGVTKEVLESLKNNAPLRKDIFGSENTTPEKHETKAKAGEYLRAKFMGDYAQAKALALTTHAGEELVPEYFSSEIIRLAPSYGLVRKYARNYPMAGLTQHVPTAGSVTAYRIGHGAAATSSAPTTDNLTLTAEKVVAMIPVENELLKDANVDVVDLITRLAAEALAKKEDTWGLLGEGVGEGIFQHASVPAVTLGSGDTEYADIVPDDLLDLLDAIDENALTNAKWLMSFSVFNALRKAKASTSGEYMIQPPTGGQPATIWNIPVIFSQVMPKTVDADQAGKKFLALANMDYMLFGDRKQYSLEISKEATIRNVAGNADIQLFSQDMSAVKVMERVDIKLAEPAKAFVTGKTAAS